jgi:hypothetical protein
MLSGEEPLIRLLVSGLSTAEIKDSTIWHIACHSCINLCVKAKGKTLQWRHLRKRDAEIASFD